MKDKIIFWLDGDFTQFGLAKSLQSQYDSEFYSIIDIPDKMKKFFREQDLVKFEKVWFYHDHIIKGKNPDIGYLKGFEEKYKIDLWLLAYNERLFFGYNDYYRFDNTEILSILEQECRLFEKVLDEVRPDFLIAPITNMHFNHLFYLICKARGIKILMLIPTRLGKGSMISDQPEKFDQLAIRSKTFQNRSLQELQLYMNKYTASKDSEKFRSKFLVSRLKLATAALQFLLSTNYTNASTHYTYYGRTKIKVLFKSLFYQLKKKYRTKFIDRVFLHNLPTNEPFIFFPLQTEPERSLLLGSPHFTDQLQVIKQIAKSIPIDYKLYVKEHPTQIVRDWRKISFYNEIRNLPNVRLIHPSVSTFDILKNCSLVITIGGTSGFESLFYGKSSITFAEVLYSDLKSIYTLKNIEELPKIIKTALLKKVDVEDLNRFINDLEINSFEVDLITLQNEEMDQFYHGGFLIDVDIPVPKMRAFLERFNSTFDKLAMEHVKKIKQHKEHLLH